MSSKLDLILHANQFRRAESPEDIENVKADIKTLMLEVVGEDRTWDSSEPYDNPDMAQGYNEALSDIREKVEAL